MALKPKDATTKPAAKPQAKKPAPKKAVKKPEKKTGLIDNRPVVEVPKRISTKGMLNADTVVPVAAKKPKQWKAPEPVQMQGAVMPPPKANEHLVEQKANVTVPDSVTISHTQLGHQPVQQQEVKKESNGTMSFKDFMSR